MPFEIIRNDITKVHVDAIVNAANTTLLGGGGVDGAIHKAAGPELLAECRSLGGCNVGEVKITKGYRLPAEYVIHTVGPIWQGGSNDEERLLTDCYRNALNLAKEYELESVAFPLIASGAYGYPKDKALSTAIRVIGDFLLLNDMTVYLVVYDKTSFMLSEKLFLRISTYVDDRYIEEHQGNERSRNNESNLVREDEGYDTSRYVESIEKFQSKELISKKDKSKKLQSKEHRFKKKTPLNDNQEPESLNVIEESDLLDAFLRVDHLVQESYSSHEQYDIESLKEEDGTKSKRPQWSHRSLDDVINQLDETFSEMLLRLIDEKGMTDAETYKKANVDRKLFSKIRNDVHYKPSKPTAIAFAIALRLNLDETKDLLIKAGFALSPSSKFDLIIAFFIEEENYNIFEINEALFAFDQSLLCV